MKMKVLALSLMSALVLSSCVHRMPPHGEHAYVYTFVSPAPGAPDDTKKLIQTLLGATVDDGALYRSDDGTVYYVSRTDVTERFERNLNTDALTFNKSMQKYMGS